jgi:hypothetical protein
MSRRDPRAKRLPALLMAAGTASLSSGCFLLTDPDRDKIRDTVYVERVVPDRLTIEVGESRQITGVRAGGPEQPTDVSVFAADRRVATVRYDGRGLDPGGGRAGDFLATVTGVAPGQTVIEMSTTGNVGAGRNAGQTIVTVVARQLSVDVSPRTSSLDPGQQTMLACIVTATRTGETITGLPVTWTTSDPSVAIVAPDGTVTAIIDGTATITCRLDTGESASAQVTVTTPRSFNIMIAPSSALMTLGSTANFTCIVADGAGVPVANPQLTWSTSDASIVQVTQTGAVAALASGTATITCMLPTGESASAQVLVTGPQPPNLTEIAGGYSLNANRTSDSCPVGTLPPTITNPGPIDVSVIPSSGSVLVQIKSTSDVVGPYTPATGDYQGHGVVAVTTGKLSETVTGRWHKRASAAGFVIELIAALAYELLDSTGQSVCRGTYDALYTKIQ